MASSNVLAKNDNYVPDYIFLVMENIPLIKDAPLKQLRKELTEFFEKLKLPIHIGAFKNSDHSVVKLRLYNSCTFDLALETLQANPFRSGSPQTLSIRHFNAAADADLFKKESEKRREQVVQQLKPLFVQQEQEQEQELLKEEATLAVNKNFTHFYVIDFEAASSYPLEVCIAKLNFDTFELVDTMHYLVNYDTVPDHVLKQAESSKNFCHGIEYNSCTFATRDIAKVWNHMLTFMGLKPCSSAASDSESTLSLQHLVNSTEKLLLVAKGPSQENDCIEALKLMNNDPRLNTEFLNNWVIDVTDFLLLKFPQQESIFVNHLKKDNLDRSKKCEYHKTKRPKYHCAMEDVHMIVSILQACKSAILVGNQQQA